MNYSIRKKENGVTAENHHQMDGILDIDEDTIMVDIQVVTRVVTRVDTRAEIFYFCFKRFSKIKKKFNYTPVS